VRVVDDCGKFHLQYPVEFLDDSIDIKLESPSHRVLLPVALFLIGRRYDTIGFRPSDNERTGSTVAGFTETESDLGTPAASQLSSQTARLCRTIIAYPLF
jgi:hypothetical protein